MQVLFIGQTYIDVTFLTDHMPTGDEKHVASAYAVSFGGNAVTAAFCCAKLGIVPDLIATVANDWLGRMFQDMSAKYGNFDPSAQGTIPRRCPSSCRRTASARSCAAATTSISTRFPHAQSRRLPRAARRRPPAGRRHPLCEAVPRGRHPDLARRRRPARQHPMLAGIHRRRRSSPSGCASRWI